MSNSNVVVAVGDTPPANPIPGVTLWLSTALADARIPAHPGETSVVIDNGSSVQEPNVWEYQGVVHALVNEGGVQVLYTAPAPDGPFTSQGTVLGGGQGGEASGAVHAGLYTEGSTPYLFYTQTGATTCWLATASMAAPKVWTKQGAVLQKSNGFLAGLSQFGNFSAHRTFDGRFRLLAEGVWGGGKDSWISTLFEGAGPQAGGAFTNIGLLHSLDVGQVYGVTAPPKATSGQLEGYLYNYSCGPVTLENGQYVQIYHAGPVSTTEGFAGTDIYRATSRDGKVWTPDLGGYPLHARTDIRWEIDQCADPYHVRIGGVWWIYWTAASNRNGRFVIKAAAMQPTLKIYDGYKWRPVSGMAPDSAGQNRNLRHRARMTWYYDQPVLPFDDLAIDPKATLNQTVPMPPASIGTEVRYAHVGDASGTFIPTPLAGDAVLGSNPAVTTGQMVRYKCYKQGYWSRGSA